MRPYRHRVNYYETDKMGITHHANYIHWMEEARIDFLDQIGWGYDRLAALAVGVVLFSRIEKTFMDTV